jgi:hypothetical protein
VLSQGASVQSRGYLICAVALTAGLHIGTSHPMPGWCMRVFRRTFNLDAEGSVSLRSRLWWIRGWGLSQSGCVCDRYYAAVSQCSASEDEPTPPSLAMKCNELIHLEAGAWHWTSTSDGGSGSWHLFLFVLVPAWWYQKSY